MCWKGFDSNSRADKKPEPWIPMKSDDGVPFVAGRAESQATDRLGMVPQRALLSPLAVPVQRAARSR